MENELITFRSDMFKFARLQLRDETMAEDAVQEALAAAISGMAQFNSRSKLKTWVFAILKNKIIDIIRQRSRTPNANVSIDEIPEDAYESLFDEGGHWHEDTRPSAWGNPEESYSRQQFWAVLEICLTKLPESTARVFMMREMLGFETDEICKELAISPTNCWVVLHRARMALRLCLNEKWFEAEKYDAEL